MHRRARREFAPQLVEQQETACSWRRLPPKVSGSRPRPRPPSTSPDEMILTSCHMWRFTARPLSPPLPSSSIFGCGGVPWLHTHRQLLDNTPRLEPIPPHGSSTIGHHHGLQYKVVQLRILFSCLGRVLGWSGVDEEVTRGGR